MSTSANALYGSPKREISVILPVLNEEKYLEDAVRAILAQQYDGKLEVILAVAPSVDRTLEIAQQLHINDPRVVIVDNPTGRTAAGLNRAIATAQYSIIVRVDGHSNIPNNYCQLISEILEKTGAVNVGGVMAAEGQSLFQRAVARAMRSPLGVGASRFHTGGSAGEVDTVYLGAFRKEALLAVGGFDERFTRAQDWELNFRLRQAGGVVFFDPRLVVTYRPRSTIKALAKQYFEYGRWRRVVSRRHQGTINYRYLAPPFTVAATTISLLLGWLVSPYLLMPALVYALFILISSAIVGKSAGEILCLPTILLTMHISWGLGFLTSPKSLAPDVTLRP
ncbi:MAG: glycosyltransferase [Actinobacteria bacterium]|jgi:glycosyltransferase involved in cell wall biosynthesis|nr:glycosyltransferase [Actinomycetota bacterium]